MSAGLKAKINKIWGEGNVEISFMQSLYVPDKFEEDSLSIKVIPGLYSDLKQLAFTYNVTGYSQKTLELEIRFENPTQISKEISDPDILEITLNKPYFFARSLQELDSDDEIVLNKRLPRVY